MRAASSSAMTRSASRMLFRCTSVGCAVSTGEMKARSSVAAIRSPSMPRRASRSKVIASDPSCRWPCRLVDGAPAQMVPVLGDVGQVREVAEGADHADGALAAQARQQPVEVAAGALVALQPVGDRELADALDQLEGGPALLLADHVAEDAARGDGCRRPAAGSSAPRARSRVSALLFIASMMQETCLLA